MTRLVLISIFVALTVNIISVECSNDAPSTNIELTVVQNLTDYLRANPDVKLLHPMIKEPLTAGPSPRTKLIYKTGNRVNGDVLQATDSNKYQWTNPQEIKLSLKYPKTGTGAAITFVQIDVEQSTDLGQAYITDGGIGQKKITMIIEAKQTVLFQYKADIFGYY